MNREITILQHKTKASRTSINTLTSLVILSGYHQLSSQMMLSVNLVLTFIVAVGSVLTRTEEAAMVSFFAYLPVIVFAILQMRVSIVIKSTKHIPLLQAYSIASFMFAGIALSLRIYSLAVNRHHGKHILDFVVLACQVCEMIISIVILVGADQEGFALGQISSLVARLHNGELVQSDAHQHHLDSLGTKSIWAHTRTILWALVPNPARLLARWRTQRNTHAHAD